MHRMSAPRRYCLAALAVAFLVCAGPAPVEARIELTDLRGRAVVLDKPTSRLAVDDGRFILALALLHPDPVSVVAAWPRDVNRIGPETYEAYRVKFPALATLPQISSSAGELSLESILAASPDIAVFSIGAGPNAAQIAQLEGAGIKVVFIDFFTSPFANLAPSLKILGQLTGREAQADSFIAFRAERLKRIANRVAAIPADKRPAVFLEAHAGLSNDCCSSPGRGNVGDYIDFVGGRNIGADVITRSFGKLNIEYVMERDPAVYIATGGPHLEKTGGLVLGPGYDEGRARASLARMAARKGLAELSAVKRGDVHGFSHQLINSPLDILAVEVFARWIHPELFADLDPAATLAEVNRR